ncbi:MAG TPA: hypothetical protein VGA20_04810 [Gemmatimonadales bacterium]
MPSPSPDVSRTLDRLRREAEREWTAKQEAERRVRARETVAATRRRAAARARRAAAIAARITVLVALPFLLLVRVAVSVHALGYSTWLALGLAAAAAVGVVTLYAAWVAHKLMGRARIAVMAKTVALPLVLGYTLYTLLYISAGNAKSDGVRAQYLRLHPLLRVATSTLILADGDLLVTDMGRAPEDYERMGLPRLHASRHLRQKDGYTHAVDLRTAGRGWIGNGVRQFYFVLMGFDTLRHAGTADHLHVELPAPPGG